MSRGRGEGLPRELKAVVREVLEAAALDLPARAEVEADLRSHFEDGLEAGVSPADLRARFGDPVEAGRRIARARPNAGSGRDVDAERWWMSGTEWWTEVRRAVRRLARTPGFAVVVIATMALGVGANTAVFSVVDAVLLKPLPYREPERLVRVYTTRADQDGGTNYLPGPEAVALGTWHDVFESVGVFNSYRASGADLTEGTSVERVTVVPVDSGYFASLGYAPELGRTFTEAESLPPVGGGDDGQNRNPARVVVLSHALWTQRFGGSPQVLGHSIVMSGTSYEIVGVMPRSFTDPIGAPADVWVPLDLAPGGDNYWNSGYLSAVARVRPDLTVAGAQERMRAHFAGLREADPAIPDRWTPRLVSLRDDLVGSTRRTMLWILAAAAGLVLFTACVNLANLLFAQGLGRIHDIALRAALGGGRNRIVATLLCETAVLAALGGAAGIGLGRLGVRLLLALSPDALPRIAAPTFGWPAFTFALAATLAALLLAGVTPALRLAMVTPAGALRSDSKTASGGRGIRRIRDGMAILQVAVALVLVTGAALLGRSFATLANVPLHMDPQGVLTFEVNLPTARYPDGASREAFHVLFNERLAALHQVERAGAVSWLPVSGPHHTWAVYWDPQHPDGSNDHAWYSTDARVFSGDYFAALDIRVERGMDPGRFDPAGDDVVWINRALARSAFGATDPIGHTVLVDGARRVVGIVDDVPQDAEGNISPTVYIPHADHAADRNWALIETVRVRDDIDTARERIAGVLAAMDPELVLFHPRPLEQVVAVARAQDRFATALMGAFALLALSLALVGTYGVLAESVAGRTREFGIRIALGANRGSVRSTVLRYAMRLVVPGIGLGLVGAWVSAGWIRSLLFQVQPRDPFVYGAAASIFVLVGVLAAWAPARRATRVDPIRAFSAE